MEIVPIKPQPFRRIIVVAAEREKAENKSTKTEPKSLLTEDPRLWKTFRRLSQSDKTDRLLSKKHDCNFVPPTVTYPDTGGMRCMCYENLMSLIRDHVSIPVPRLYRIPSGKPPKSTLESIRPSWTRRALHGFHDNEQLQYPLPTVIVRWQLKRQLPKYDTKTLRYILEPYGKIHDIRVTTPNSCLVIFNDLASACAVVETRSLGYPTNILHCTWWHTAMTNKSIVSRANRLAVRTDPFIPF